LSNITDNKKTVKIIFRKKYDISRTSKRLSLFAFMEHQKCFGKGLIDEQEVLNNIAEMMMETYVSESLLLRVEKMSALKGNVLLYKDMVDVNLFDTAGIIRKSAFEAIGSFSTPESCQTLTEAIENLSRVKCVNVKDARRRIANKLIEDNVYKF